MRFALVLLAMCTSSVVAMAQSNSSREKSFPPINFNYLDGEGYVASIIKNFTVTLVERMSGNGQISTTYVVEYDIYNRTWYSEQYGWAYGALLDQQGNVILQNAFRASLDRASCTYGGYRHVRQTGGPIPNYFDIGASVQFVTDRVSGRQGPCLLGK